jgi:predicted nucleic acid-binding protein
VSPTCFVDTNVLVYARDASEPAKQPAAARWLRLLWATRAGRVSSQVLNEYYSVVTEKLRPGLSRDEARADVRSLMAWAPVPTDGPVVEGAWTVQDRYGLSWWDALVASAAQVAGCAWLLTDNLQHGQVLDGVTVVDPFRTEPQELLG